MVRSEYCYTPHGPLRPLTIAAVVLGVALLSACGTSSGRAQSCPAHFDTKEWKHALRRGGHEERLRLARSVKRCHYVKRGDGKARVARVLGRAKRDELQTRAEYEAEWLYDLGLTNDAMGPGDEQFLFVKFSHGRVTSL